MTILQKVNCPDASGPRVYFDGADWQIQFNQDHLVGYSGATFLKGGGSYRFTNVTVPNGATINSAKIIVTAGYTNVNVVVNTKVRGCDEDNQGDFADYAAYAAAARTAAVNWAGIAAWTSGVQYDSPDIASIIQTIVNRVGWASGNAMTIFWDDHDDLSDHVNTHYRSSDHAFTSQWEHIVTLYIDYSAGWANKCAGVSSPAKVIAVAAASVSKVLGVA